jgi:hypothetical protein
MPMIVAEIMAVATWGAILSAYIAHQINEN